MIYIYYMNNNNISQADEEWVAEANKFIEELAARIARGEVKITVVEERVITPDQKVGHQFRSGNP